MDGFVVQRKIRFGSKLREAKTTSSFYVNTGPIYGCNLAQLDPWELAKPSQTSSMGQTGVAHMRELRSPTMPVLFCSVVPSSPLQSNHDVAGLGRRCRPAWSIRLRIQWMLQPSFSVSDSCRCSDCRILRCIFIFISFYINFSFFCITHYFS